MQIKKLLVAGLAIPAGLILTGYQSTGATNISDIGFSSHAGSYLIGRSAGRQKDFDVAATFFSRLHDENPASFPLIEKAFALNVTTGDMTRSVELAEKVIAVKSGSQLARFVLGLNELKEKNYAKARQHFSKTTKNRIGELASAILIAWTYAGEGNSKKAYAELNKLESQGNIDKFVAAHRAYIADFLGDTDKAQAAFDKAFAARGNSLRLTNSFGTFLWRNGKAGRARLVFAGYLNTTERNPIIVDKLKRLNAKQAAPKMISTPSQGVFEVLYALASALSDKRNAPIALIYNQLALFMRPDTVVGKVLLAETYESISRYEKAVKIYETIDKNSPLLANIEIQMANDLDSLDRADDAIGKLDGLIAREPNNFQAWSSKGSILYGRKKWADAAQALSLALARVKEKQRRHWVVYYYRGMSYERDGHWEKAEPDFQMALKLRPAQPSVLNYLGYSWIDRGEHLAKAMSMVEKAAELKPRDGYIIDSVGWAYYRLGKYEKAVKKLERAVKLKPGDPTINDHLGDAYWRVGRKLEAGFQWAHARDSKPEKKDLEIILKKIKEGLADQPSKS